MVLFLFFCFIPSLPSYLFFFTAVHLFGLTWQLQPVEGQLYENGVSKGTKGTESVDPTYTPIGGKVSDKTERKGTSYVGLHVSRSWLCPLSVPGCLGTAERISS